MPGNGKRGGQIAPGKSLLCPCGGVVDRRAAAQPVLKCGAVFAYVVQSSGIARLIGGSECCAELSRERSCAG